jgi:hypothetical protein
MTQSLSGHRWLRWAYWCHLGSIVLRVAKDLIGRRPVSLVLLPLQVLGFVFLLLFLRKTADVLARHDLRRLVDIIFGMAAAAALSGALLAAEAVAPLGLMRQLPFAGKAIWLGMPIVLFVLMLGAYAILLWRVAEAAAGMARFLESDSEPEAGPDGLSATSQGTV